MADWHIEGEFFEACNCDFLCPCITSNSHAPPTRGGCIVAMAYRIDAGKYGAVPLAGLLFSIVIQSPGPMAEGNLALGVIVDERANAAQSDAMVAIASGKAGGPMGGMGGLVTRFAGVERRPIHYASKGFERSVSIPGLLDEAIAGLPSEADATRPILLANGTHPANQEIALATAHHAHLHAFGIDWDEVSGKTNGHYATFAWRGRVP